MSLELEELIEKEEKTHSKTSSSDHLSLRPTDRDVVSDSEETDVRVGVLSEVLFLGQSEVKDISSVCKARKRKGEVTQKVEGSKNELERSDEH
jgi:hypothetical protein